MSFFQNMPSKLGHMEMSSGTDRANTGPGAQFAVSVHFPNHMLDLVGVAGPESVNAGTVQEGAHVWLAITSVLRVVGCFI